MSPINFDNIPEISIILCTYNRAKYLNNCINSIISQSYQNWELLIVDDGSTDNTFEIANLYLAIFTNIRYLKHQNKKQCYAKNAGIQASFGKYITFLDSDDFYKVHHLESRLAYMEANPEIDLISGGFSSESEIMVPDYYQPGKLINAKECVLGATFFGKRNVFFQLQGFNHLAYGEDTDLWERAQKIFHTQKITAPETYVYTKVAENSITKDFLGK